MMKLYSFKQFSPFVSCSSVFPMCIHPRIRAVPLQLARLDQTYHAFVHITTSHALQILIMDVQDTTTSSARSCNDQSDSQSKIPPSRGGMKPRGAGLGSSGEFLYLAQRRNPSGDGHGSSNRSPYLVQQHTQTIQFHLQDHPARRGTIREEPKRRRSARWPERRACKQRSIMKKN